MANWLSARSLLILSLALPVEFLLANEVTASFGTFFRRSRLCLVDAKTLFEGTWIFSQFLQTHEKILRHQINVASFVSVHFVVCSSVTEYIL